MSDQNKESAWSFEGISKPGWSQIPNELYDEIQPNIDPFTFSIVSAIFREYFGWHANAPKPLSLSELMMRTGLTRPTVVKCLKVAIKKGIIVCVPGDRTHKSCYAPHMKEEVVYSVYHDPAQDPAQVVNGMNQGVVNGIDHKPAQVVNGMNQGVVNGIDHQPAQVVNGMNQGVVNGVNSLKETEKDKTQRKKRERSGASAAASPNPIASVHELPESEPELPARSRRLKAGAKSSPRHTTDGDRERDPLLDHPAIMTYRQIVRRHMPVAVRPLVAEKVPPDEASIARWRTTVLDWLATSGNWQNITGMLDCFERHVLLSEQYRRRANGRSASPSTSETLMRQNGVYTLPNGETFTLPGDNTWTGEDEAVSASGDGGYQPIAQDEGEDATRR